MYKSDLAPLQKHESNKEDKKFTEITYIDTGRGIDNNKDKFKEKMDNIDENIGMNTIITDIENNGGYCYIYSNQDKTNKHGGFKIRMFFPNK